MLQQDEIKQQRQSKSAMLDALVEAGADVRSPHSIKCPFHKEKHASSGVYLEDNEWKFKCHGCGFGGDVFDVLAKARGKNLSDVLPVQRKTPAPPPPRHMLTRLPPAKPSAEFPTIESIREKLPHVTAVYAYTNPDAENQVDLIVVRQEPPNERKEFKQIRPAVGGGYERGGIDRKPLYRRREIAVAEHVVFVEGEKCVHALEELNIVATSAPGGCKAKKTEINFTPLKGKRVTLWPDNDEGGIAHMREVAEHLQRLTPPAKCYWIDPAQLGLEPKGDVVDFTVPMGDTVNDRRIAVDTVIDAAEPLGGARELVQWVEDAIAGKIKSITWPWRAIDRLTKALLPGAVVVICGNPDASKSLAVIQAALHWHTAGVKTDVYMLEEMKSFHLRRALAQLAGEAHLTEPEYCQANPDKARQAIRDHETVLNEFADHITTCPDEQIKLEELGKWVRERAENGARIIIVDPVTAAETSDKPWRDDLRFINDCKQAAGRHGCSVILITHPRKGSRIGNTLDDLASGAAYQRFTQTVLWFEKHVPAKDVMLVTPMGNIGDKANRIVKILKARNGRGSGLSIAMDFSNQNLTFKELGVVKKDE